MHFLVAKGPLAVNCLVRMLCALLGLGYAAVLQAAVFSLDMGRYGKTAGVLEIAREADFKAVLVSIQLGEKREYLVNLPETAVYYLRVRQQDRWVWQEAILVLLENSADDRIPRLSWDEVPSSGRYRLWLSRNQTRTLWLETPERTVHLHRLGAPWLIQVRAITESGRHLPLQKLSLQWVAGRSPLSLPQAEKKAPTVDVDLNAPDDDQVVYEPDDKDLLQGQEESPMDAFIARVTPVNLPPLTRRHEVYLWLRYLREDFTLDKKDRFSSDPSVGLGTGGSGQYFLAPNLSLTGMIDTHSTQTDFEASGQDTPQSEQKRFRIHVAAALDLLNTNLRTTDWSLELGPVFGLIQIPLQENEQKFTDFGLRFGTHHFPSRAALWFLLLKSGSREIDLRWTSPWTVRSIRAFVGLYAYNSRQSAGSVTGIFHENGLRLGLERDF